MQDMVCVCRDNGITLIQLNKMADVYEHQWVAFFQGNDEQHY